MDDTTYTLEWRGTRKSGYTYGEIEAALESAELHSLYRISVGGKWVLLRDFVEQRRAQAAAAAQRTYQSQAAQAAVPPPPPAPEPSPLPSYDEAAAPHSLPLHPARAAAAGRPQTHKPAWLWPVVILSGTVCLLLALVVVYLLATSQPAGQRSTAAANSQAAPHEVSAKPAQAPAAPAAPAPAATENKTLTASAPPPSTAPATPPAVAASPPPPPAAAKPEPKSPPLKLLPLSSTGKEIFPSAVISTATVDWNGDTQTAEDKKTDDDAQLRKHQTPIYGDENSWMGIRLEGMKKGAQVSVEIAADGLIKPSSWSGKLVNVSEKGNVIIQPKILWNFEALIKAFQQRPVNVSFSATVEGKEIPAITETYTLRSINDCPFFIKRDKSGNTGTDLNFMFAAYVNENHPLVQKILTEALECHIVDEFDGYASKDTQKVLYQVWAIWNALQRRGIKYSSVTTTTPSESTYCQAVRFLDQSIDGHQANCVDGSVLMASILRKIGIKAYLVLVPDHCFLAFDEVPNSAALPTGLETTLLGSDVITDVKKLDLLPQQEKHKEYEASKNTFLQALNSGDKKIQSCARNLQGGSDPQYALISIEGARKMGIMPIPFSMDK